MARARIFSVGLNSCFSCEMVSELCSAALVSADSSSEGLGTLSSEAG